MSDDEAVPGGTEWKVHGERPLYESQWVELALVDVELPDGQRFEHHVVRLPTAAIAAVVDDEDRVLLMWRHRFVSNVWNWELPGGLVDEGETPAETIAREIVEETGYCAGRLQHLVTYQPMIGMVDSPHHLFLATDLERVGEPTETTEMDHMEWIPLADVPKLIAGGKIANSGTLVALLQVLATRPR